MTKYQEEACIRRLQQIADIAWNNSDSYEILRCDLCYAFEHRCMSCPANITGGTQEDRCGGDAEERRSYIYFRCPGYKDVAKKHYRIFAEACAKFGLDTELIDV